MDESAMGPYGYPATEIFAMQFGRGLDLTNPNRTLLRAVGKAKAGTAYPGRSGQLTFKKVDTLSDLEASVTAILGYNMNLIGAGGDTFDMTAKVSTKMNNKSVVVHANASFTEMTPVDLYNDAEPLALTTEAAAFLAEKGPEIFRQRYGDGFVSVLGKIGSYNALMTFESSTFELHTDVKMKLESKLDAAIASAKNIAELDTKLDLAKNNVKLQIEKFYVGEPAANSAEAAAFAALSAPMSGAVDDIDVIRKEAAFAQSRFPGANKFVYIHPFSVLDSYQQALAAYLGSDKTIANHFAASEALMADVTRAFMVYAHVIAVATQGLTGAARRARELKEKLEAIMTSKDVKQVAQIALYHSSKAGFSGSSFSDGKAATQDDWNAGRALYEGLVNPEPMHLMFLMVKDNYGLLGDGELAAGPAPPIKLGNSGVSVHVGAFSGGDPLNMGAWYLDYQVQRPDMDTGLNIIVLEPTYDVDHLAVTGITPTSGKVKHFDTSTRSNVSNDARSYLRDAAARKDTIIVCATKGNWSYGYYSQEGLMDALNVDNLLGLTKPVEWAAYVHTKQISRTQYGLHNSSYAWISYYDKSLGRRVAVEDLAYSRDPKAAMALPPYPTQQLFTRPQLYAKMWTALTQSEPSENWGYYDPRVISADDVRRQIPGRRETDAANVAVPANAAAPRIACAAAGFQL